MEQPANDNVDQVDASATIPVTSLGSMLREARERLGLSVWDVANQIKFAPRQIEALEADDFRTMPEAAFLRGFVRSYGKLLQLDLATLYAVLPETKAATLSAASGSNQTPYPNAQTARRQNLIWMSAALIFVAIALGFAISNLNVPTKKSTEAQVETSVTLPGQMVTLDPHPTQADAPASAVESLAAAANTPASIAEVPAQAKQAVAKPVTPPQAQSIKPVAQAGSVAQTPVTQIAVQAGTVAEVSATKTHSTKATIPIDTLLGTQPVSPVAMPDATSQSAGLRIVFGDESWTEIKDKNGKILSSQVNLRGSELRLEGHAPYTMLIGHAQSARLYYKGKQVDLAPYINKYSEVAHLTLE
jgi:cytoskeleton protein RodZ